MYIALLILAVEDLELIGILVLDTLGFMFRIFPATQDFVFSYEIPMTCPYGLVYVIVLGCHPNVTIFWNVTDFK